MQKYKGKIRYDGDVYVDNGVVTMDELTYLDIERRFQRKENLTLALGATTAISVSILIFKALKG